MHQRLNLRLKALEKRLPDGSKPPKALLPEWLMEDLRQQGIRFDASGRPEKSSIEAKPKEQIVSATPAPSPAPPASMARIPAISSGIRYKYPS